MLEAAGWIRLKKLFGPSLPSETAMGGAARAFDITAADSSMVVSALDPA